MEDERTFKSKSNEELREEYFKNNHLLAQIINNVNSYEEIHRIQFSTYFCPVKILYL